MAISSKIWIIWLTATSILQNCHQRNRLPLDYLNRNTGNIISFVPNCEYFYKLNELTSDWMSNIDNHSSQATAVSDAAYYTARQDWSYWCKQAILLLSFAIAIIYRISIFNSVHFPTVSIQLDNVIPSHRFKIVAVAIEIIYNDRLDMNLATKIQQVVPANAVNPNSTYKSVWEIALVA